MSGLKRTLSVDSNRKSELIHECFLLGAPVVTGLLFRRIIKYVFLPPETF